jgi:two-component system, sensor histidine kinase and response regulator
VLLDVLMPRMDGFETCARLRALRGGADVPIVFLTALSDIGSHQRALESGVDDFLTKPINRTELLLRVRSLLWIKRLKDNLNQGYDLIRSQRDALLQTQRQKEELIQLIVHDLKNPLSSIQMNARFLADAALGGERQDAARDIMDSTVSLCRMVMNLLDICRSEDGVLVPKWAEVDLRSLTEGVVQEHGRESRDKGVQLRATVTLDGLMVVADADLLRRVLENLIVNAIRHSSSSAFIDVVALSSDLHVELQVRDQGPGVPEVHREKVFDKYARLESEPSGDTERNRGLGLTFCRIAAEAHGGKIWVEANEPRGAAFIVRLPRRSEVGPASDVFRD